MAHNKVWANGSCLLLGDQETYSITPGTIAGTVVGLYPPGMCATAQRGEVVGMVRRRKAAHHAPHRGCQVV